MSESISYTAIVEDALVSFCRPPEHVLLKRRWTALGANFRAEMEHLREVQYER